MPVDASCGFRIDGLAPGKVELFAVASQKAVALIDVDIAAAQLLDVGAVATSNGSFVHVRVSAPSHQKLVGTLIAPDVPLTATELGASGMVSIGPFPQGCFRLEVTANGLGEQDVSPWSCRRRRCRRDGLVRRARWNEGRRRVLGLGLRVRLLVQCLERPLPVDRLYGSTPTTMFQTRLLFRVDGTTMTC